MRIYCQYSAAFLEFPAVSVAEEKGDAGHIETGENSVTDPGLQRRQAALYEVSVWERANIPVYLN
jgi:hypothetical protein